MTPRKKAFGVLALTFAGLTLISYAVAAMLWTGSLALTAGRNVFLLAFYMVIGLVFGAVTLALLELAVLHPAAKEDRAGSPVNAILNASSDATALLSPQGALQAANGPFRELLGLPSSVADGVDVRQLKPQVDAIFGEEAAVIAWIVSGLTDGQQRLTLTVARSAQQPDLELASMPLSDSTRKYLGRLLVVKPAVSSLEQAKSEFVALISHELRTPLTSIQGYTDVLLGNWGGGLSDGQRRFLTIVKRNSERLIALIGDLLDASLLEAGKIQLRRKPVGVEGLIRNVARKYAHEIEERRQILSLVVPAALPPALADGERLEQILSVLVSNAIRYTPPEGRIEVVAREEGNRLRVSVQDTGVGLTPEEQVKLFTKFFRADNPLVSESSGTGLGLVIARSLVRMHGGDIDVSSVPNEGSSFSFSLPTAPRQALAEAVSSAQPARIMPGGKILVVDDETDIANLIQLYLERAGYQVLTAKRATEALRLARAEHPDLITLDIVLPGTDGFTVLEWLKNDPETQGIPVVLISMLANEGQGKVLGAVDYITKPVPSDVLLERVGRILVGDQSRLVLVVDDHDEIRELIAGHLRLAGYRVIVAENGARAVELARKELPGLIVMDIQMPVMDGIAALRELRSDGRTCDVPVIIMTVHSGLLEENRSTLELLGVAALMRKPFTVEQLATAIAEGLGRSVSP